MKVRRSSMKAEMDTLEARKATLTSKLATAPLDRPDFLPSISSLYARKVAQLSEALKPPGRPAGSG